MELTDLKIGQRVAVRTWDGMLTYGKIDDVLEDVKNGRPGIDYTSDLGATLWAYLDQVEVIVR